MTLVCIRVFRQQKNRRSKVSHVARCRALHSQAHGRTYIVRTTVGPNDNNPPKIRLKIQEIDWSYFCLLLFMREKIVISSLFNQRSWKLCKYAEKTRKLILFWRILPI